MAQEKPIESSEWKQIESDDLAEEVYLIDGTCPQCKHGTYWIVRQRTVYGLVPWWNRATSIKVSCICNEKDDRVPVEGTGRTGCGWHAEINFST